MMGRFEGERLDLREYLSQVSEDRQAILAGSSRTASENSDEPPRTMTVTLPIIGKY
jgi:hypothetical protein